VEGLCHVSELSEGYVRTVEDVCKVGDVMPVKLISIDEQGRFKLSRKAALSELGQEDPLASAAEPPRSRECGRDRDRDRNGGRRRGRPRR